MDIIWDIKAKTKRELVRKSWPLWSGRRWAAHPLDKTKLLWIDPGTTRIFEWSTLNCVSPEISGTSQALLSSPTRVRPQLHSTPSGTPEGIRWISSTRNGRYILCETLPNTGHERTTSARGMKLTLLSSDSRGSDVSQYASQRRPLDDIAAILSRFLGFFNDRVLFLDRMFWVCSWELNAPVKTVKKHFFLPRDWEWRGRDPLAALPSTFHLNNGHEVPAVGFGTFQGDAGNSRVKDVALAALKQGYRHIDGATAYGNERDIGEAIKKSGIPRHELFITTKL
ncbi:MAG: hypothetical protein LQ347_005904 [Umbilicaria vellea]|nr:MAG: hypothetical protein LQ347_005904 [Umbilicaria vellea]